MSEAIAVRIVQRETSPLTRLREQARRPRGFMGAVGEGVEKRLRGHFLEREKEPNKKGWPKQHFWARRIRANTVLTEVSDSHAVIDIAAPEFRMKLRGGTIKPIEAKYLAIPARREAYGKSPRSFGNLRFRPTRNGGVLVVEKRFQGPLQRGIKRIDRREDGGVYYFLVKSATQKADPRAMPALGELLRAACEDGQQYLTREARGA